MKAAAWAWWCVLGLAALAPVAVRSAILLSHRSVPVDPDGVQAGHKLFRHEWQPGDPLAGGDGLGPVFNASSCVACHFQNGTGGSGGLSENVTIFAVTPDRPGEKPREGVVHARSTLHRSETLADVDPALSAVSRPTLRELAQLAPEKQRKRLQRGAGDDEVRLLFFQAEREQLLAARQLMEMEVMEMEARQSNARGRMGRRVPPPRRVDFGQLSTPALFGAKLIDDLPEWSIVANERRQQLKWGQLSPTRRHDTPVGRVSRLPNGRIGRFGWKGQTANLATFVQAACANELGLSNPGQPQPLPLFKPNYVSAGLDLTAAQCYQLTAFVASLPRPMERLPEDPAAACDAVAGKNVFHKIGCAECHTPDLGPVAGLYSDLLLHSMDPNLEGAGSSYGGPEAPEPGFAGLGRPAADEWRTPPLWGVADSAPYLHDGRAATLEQAVALHGGQGSRAAERFGRLDRAAKDQLMAFLKTLHAP